MFGINLSLLLLTFCNQKKKFDISLQIMEGYSSSDSNISLDSLELEIKKKSTLKEKVLDDNVDTILVPFYEKDVLIKVPKDKKSKNIHEGRQKKTTSDKFTKEPQPINNYLVKKDARKTKHTTYLEMFRKQFAPTQSENVKIETDIRSISPEFGDTYRESFREAVNSPASDFLNSESYNEMYYDKLMNQEINNYLEQTYREQLKFTEDLRTNSPDNIHDTNLKSISDVPQPRRNARRATVQPIPSIKLGGLGPDMENIRPRLERARSLQRYSEKVRMENRVRIYKKSVQEEIDKKGEKELPMKRQESAKTRELKGEENSFLLNKNSPDKASQLSKRICCSKSANVKETKRVNESNEILCNNSNNSRNFVKNKITNNYFGPKVDEQNKKRIKSCDSKRSDNDHVINQVNINVPVPPVQISFLVNMGGLRPSSALRKLEAKHRMYQEKVKAFTTNNYDTDNGNRN